jgi:hypothetical protein
VPFRARVCLFLSVLLGALGPVSAQRAPNVNPYYQQLRTLLPGGEVVSVKDLSLHRDAATFTLRQGNIAFYGEVNGKITGAVFKGDGHLHITPPTLGERRNLSIFTHTEEFDEDFDQVVFRFTDDTSVEIHKAASGKGTLDAGYVRAAMDLQSFARHHLNENLDLRLLQDVMSPVPGAYFLAAVHGRKDAHLFFVLDPQGVSWVSPEEVALFNWNWTDETLTIPLAFHRSDEYANGTASGDERNGSTRILHDDLDVSIEKGGFLSSVATVHLEAQQNGVAVVPFDLYPTLRVSQVTNAKGDQLDCVQEKKEDDPNFAVILAQPLKKGEVTTLKITYGGKDVVLNEGGANYYPIARENWYPNSGQGFGDYATYRMLFHVPKGLQIIATGTKVNDITDGKITTTEWKTDVPLPVVGFSLGNFATKQAQFGTLTTGELTIDTYANKDIPDFIQPIANRGLGSLSTMPMLAAELSQGEAAAQVYTNYFGPLPFAHISLTQQSACNYGQSWPMLVYLPICGFFDDTQKHFLGLGGENLTMHMYWKVVTAHEVAHQWWGQTVGFRGYRDQWMSEGFADASAALFLQATRPKQDEFLEFWREERKLITDKNQFGYRPIDVGPVTMGVRLSSPKAGGNIYQDLVYPKGAYILHMIRMMMWNPKDGGDDRFRATMHDFIATHQLQAVTTEDFKSVVEKHMSPQMDLDGNHRMDWFFNEYVYGTDLPVYHFESQVTPNADGTALHLKLTQSGVPTSFKMAVPLYLEFASGKVMRLGSINIIGSSTVDQTVQLPKFSEPIRKVVINHYYDVLSIDN